MTRGMKCFSHTTQYKQLLLTLTERAWNYAFLEKKKIYIYKFGILESYKIKGFGQHHLLSRECELSEQKNKCCFKPVWAKPKLTTNSLTYFIPSGADFFFFSYLLMRPKKKVALSAGKGGYSLKNKYLKKANKQSRAWLTYSAAAYINNLKWPSDLDFIYFSISASLHVLESVRWWIALITTCSSIGFGARTVYGRRCQSCHWKHYLE